MEPITTAITLADISVMFFSALFKIVLASLAFVGVRFAISHMDKALGVDLAKDWVENADDHSKALYFGLRLIGVCILFGAVF